MRRSSVVALVPVLLVSALVGCAVGRPSSSSSDVGEPPLGQLLIVTDPRTLVLPLDSYQVSPANLPLSTKVERILTQRCLQRFGLSYTLPTLPNTQSLGRRYGLWDTAAAKTWGYHVPPDPPEDDINADPPAQVVTVLTGRGRSSYAGQTIPEGGCVGEARRKLAEGLPQVNNEFLGYQLANDSINRTENDSRARKVFDDWSTCMKLAGFDYSEPRKAINDPEFGTAKPTDHEILVAVADTKCKQATGLINLMATLETAYQKRTLEQSAEALRAMKEYLEGREKNAATLLAGN